MSTALINALRSYTQADMDGTFVNVPRQSCEEVADLIENQAALISELVGALEQIAWHSAFVHGAAGDFQRTANDALKKAKAVGAS